MLEARPQDHSWLEVWLPRLSHVAQFGLFIFTLVFSYFTVLPLYQKAVLEEAVAKKELELGSLNKMLDSSYSKLRTYAMVDFYREAMPECGGLFIERLAAPEAAPPKTRAEKIFELDIPTCLRRLAKRVESIEGLTSRDRQTFDMALERLSASISERRLQALKEYENAGSNVTDEDWYRLPADSFRVQAEGMLETLRGGVPDFAARRRISVAHAKERVGMEYETFIREGVAALRRIDWSPNR